MKKVALSSALLFMVVLFGCVTPQPKSFDQSLAYAYTTATAVLTGASNAVNQGTLSVEDAEQVLKIADQAKVLLDTARAVAVTGDMPKAEAQLQLAMNVLLELQNYVNTKVTK